MDEEFTVEQGIPLPPTQRRGGRPGTSKYPFALMGIGDSFFVPNRTPRDFSGQMQWARRTFGMCFTTRTVEGGLRVWRVKGENDE